jgi:hypothetical protein
MSRRSGLAVSGRGSDALVGLEHGVDFDFHHELRSDEALDFHTRRHGINACERLSMCARELFELTNVGYEGPSSNHVPQVCAELLQGALDLA